MCVLQLVIRCMFIVSSYGYCVDSCFCFILFSYVLKLMMLIRLSVCACFRQPSGKYGHPQAKHIIVLTCVLLLLLSLSLVRLIMLFIRKPKRGLPQPNFWISQVHREFPRN